MKNKLLFISVALCALLFVSCEKDFVQETQPIQEEEVAPSPSLKSSSIYYNRTQAAIYARSYTEDYEQCSSADPLRCTESYNPQYENFASGRKDCANFVSQCLEHGNFPVTDCENMSWSDIRGNSRYTWGYRFGYNNLRCPTQAWKEVDWLYNYLNTNYSTSISTITSKTSLAYRTLFSRVKPGDLIFFKDEDGHSYDHVMIITRVYSSNLEYCGHTNNELNANFNVLIDECAGKPLKVMRFLF